MLVACRLAGLSALESDYAVGLAVAQLRQESGSGQVETGVQTPQKRSLAAVLALDGRRTLPD